MKTRKQALQSSTCASQGGPEYPLYHSPPKMEKTIKEKAMKGIFTFVSIEV